MQKFRNRHQHLENKILAQRFERREFLSRGLFFIYVILTCHLKTFLMLYGWSYSQAEDGGITGGAWVSGTSKIERKEQKYLIWLNEEDKESTLVQGLILYRPCLVNIN